MGVDRVGCHCRGTPLSFVSFLFTAPYRPIIAIRAIVSSVPFLGRFDATSWVPPEGIAADSILGLKTSLAWHVNIINKYLDFSFAVF